MIVFNKILNPNVKNINSKSTIQEHRRVKRVVKKVKKITKSNKDFLRALGLKI